MRLKILYGMIVLISLSNFCFTQDSEYMQPYQAADGSVINPPEISSPEDTMKTITLSPVEIISKKIKIGESEFPVQKDNLINLIGQNGFQMIRKGDFFAQDVYADGMKRGDITVVIDGERYHSACPNRMDSPLSRVNPLELESIDLSKTSTSVQSGLGGIISFHRVVPGEPFILKGSLTASQGALKSYDGAVSVEGINNRISLRYSGGKPYENAQKKDYKQLYGYIENYAYSLAEASLQGNMEKIKYGFTFSYTGNVSFPYLKMDERKNRVFSSYISFNDNKLYLNYTSHLMNNELRVRQPKSLMETNARNLTIGLIGDFYEAYYRSWSADNFIIMPLGAGRIDNRLMPLINLYSASLHRIIQFSNISFSVKAGAAFYSVGDKNRLEFYRVLYPEAKDKRLFPTFGLAAAYTGVIAEGTTAGLLAEAAAEPPEAEYMFTAVKRPKGNPSWSGNPLLKEAVRATLRGSVSYSGLILEAYATNIWNYTNLNKANYAQTNYMTYGNIDAFMSGTDISAGWKYLKLNLSYIWAKNKTLNTPLSEIPPLKISAKIITPEYYNFSAYLIHTYNDAQKRIDRNLDERRSAAWNKTDAGIIYTVRNVQMSLEAENLTNENYYQHLSYLRDPFASGSIVYEPGRTFRFSLRVNQDF